jgi:hypothetical protein
MQQVPIYLISLETALRLGDMPTATTVSFSTDADSFKIDVEQRAMIRFFTLKWLNARAITIELEIKPMCRPSRII